MVLNNGTSEPSIAEAQEQVRCIQRKLHLWAKEDRGKRFNDLLNLVYSRTTLRIAWKRVRASRGSRTPGIDRKTRACIENDIGVFHFLEGIHASLKTGTYHPLPVRERRIPKAGGKIRYLAAR